MKKIVTISAVVLMSVTQFAGTALAEDAPVDAKRLYAGGGFGFNSIPGGGSATGVQLFGGYDFKFKLNEDISTALEIGYMDSGSFDRYKGGKSNSNAKGVWAAALESVPLSNKTDMLVRLGYDFGKDDGVLLGTGLQYKFDTRVAFRMEYIARQNVNSLQANILFKFK